MYGLLSLTDSQLQGAEYYVAINRLLEPEWNTIYVAAIYEYYYDRWISYSPDFSKRPDIWGTLYNQGEKNPPHSDPKPADTPFVQCASQYYDMMHGLIYF